MRAAFESNVRLCAFVLVSISVAAFGQPGRKQSSTVTNNFVTQVPTVYQHWLDEDVRWIIGKDELNAFEKLTDNNQRDHFIVQFWLRRNPTPGTSENVFKEEHYRRIAYSNEHFAAQVRGSLTDRGRIYIVYGPPDAVHRESRNGIPEEIWRYEAFTPPGQLVVIEGKFLHAGSKVVLDFLDDCQCNDYRLKSPEPK